jgi:L-asparaginase II
MRGAAVESVHRGIVAVSNEHGRIIDAWGNVDQLILPRSAAKPLQALALLETGAVQRFGLGDEHIALACASHNGEAEHTSQVQRWLDHIGVTSAALECGCQMPLGDAAAASLISAARPPTVLHNNCSGKHAGFLTTARHLREPIAGYIKADHPVQIRVATALSEMTAYDILSSPWGIDGCGIPVRSLPLSALAGGIARLGRPDTKNRARSIAARQIIQAMLSHPHLMGGRDRFDTAAMQDSGKNFIVKMGAEGVHVAAIPALGLGIALKIEDGARRAAEVAITALLERYGAISNKSAVYRAFGEVPVTNNRGEVVGAVRRSPTWLLS